MSDLAITLPLFISFMLVMNYGANYPLLPIALFPYERISPLSSPPKYRAPELYYSFWGAVFITLGDFLFKSFVFYAIRQASTYGLPSVDWEIVALVSIVVSILDYTHHLFPTDRFLDSLDGTYLRCRSRGDIAFPRSPNFLIRIPYIPQAGSGVDTGIPDIMHHLYKER